MKKYIIVDIGTSSLRVALINDKFHILNVQVLKRVAEITFDAEKEWDNIFLLIKKITDHEKEIDGFVVSSLLSWVGIDTNGKAVTPCYTYMHQCINEYVRFHESHTDQEIYSVCKRRMSAENAVFKMMYLKNNEKEVYDKIACFTTLKDFINTKLTGVMGIDHTFACYTLLYDVEKADWSEELIRSTGIDKKILPPLRRPYELLGKVRKELLEVFGLDRDVPVAVGSVDGSTGILGAGAIQPGTAVSVMGTTDVFFMVHEKICNDVSMSLVTNPHVFPGVWISGGPMGMYGGTLDWFIKNIMGGYTDIFELNRLSRSVPPGSDGVLFFPTLSGERTPFWNPLVRGTVLGMQLEHKAEHLFRAILEADGYAVRKIAETGKACGIEFKKVIALGGGSKSSLWLQIKADIMNIIHYKSSVEEATMIGSCMLLLLATGTRPEDIPDIPMDNSFSVCKKDAIKYDNLYKEYIKVHDMIANLYNREDNRNG